MITVILLTLYVVVISLMTLQSVFTVRLRLFIWGEPDNASVNRNPATFLPPSRSFTVLVPARHEEAVIGDTIEKICSSNYPPELLQILVICDITDSGTIAAVQDKLAEPGKEHAHLIVYADVPISKPHGLNKGLHAAQNEVVTIFDAEDEPHADIFQVINTIMLTEDVDVVQSGVHLMNHDSHWFSSLNVLEYFFWFKSSMHYFATTGMVPLGGNTVFVKRELLQDLGGWDERCLTEDADIGIRLSVAGARMRAVCDDEHVTREETPHSVRALVRQRTRWHQGFLQVLLKGCWRDLPLASQRVLAAYILMLPFAQALFWVMLPISLLMMVTVKLPIWLAMLTFMPLYVFGLQLFLDLAGLLEFTRAQSLRLGPWILLRTALAYFPYQALIAFAAFRAVSRQLRRRTEWEKTAHTGAHRRTEGAA